MFLTDISVITLPPPFHLLELTTKLPQVQNTLNCFIVVLEHPLQNSFTAILMGPYEVERIFKNCLIKKTFL